LTVLLDDNYPPYVFRDTGGNLQGILPDQWKLWSQETGIPVKLRGEAWSAALALMAGGQGDVLDTVFKTPERELLYDFSPAYVTINVPVYVSTSISGISGAKDLEGFLIGVKEGDASVDRLKKSGITNLKLYKGYKEVIEAAAAGDIHVFCVDEPAALYYIYKMGLESKFKETFSFQSGQFHRAVRKGDAETLQLVSDGFSRIPAAAIARIDRKWLGARLGDKRDMRGFLLGGGLGLLLLLIAGFLVLYLRRVIRTKTGELEKTVARLKDSETTSSALLQANPDILFVFDECGKILDYRSASTGMLYAKPEEFLGKNVSEVVPPALAEKTLAAIGRINSGEKQQHYEYQLEIGGSMRSYESRLLPLGGRKTLAIVRDITDRKSMEEETIRTQKLESIGLFAGGIAHDFNNILTAIMGNISLARMAPGLADEFSAYLGNAEDAVDRASALTSQLLAFAKGGAPVRSGILIAPVVRETAAFALSGSVCALKVEVEDEDAVAMADKGQICQVINNIVLNACQAMPKGGTVALKLGKAAVRGGNLLSLFPGEYVSISISDSGVGIPPENVKRIFDPYFTTKSSGTGLGLSICHSIVKHHGGGIDVQSQIGRGTTFTIYIPAAAKVSEFADAANGSANPPPGKELLKLKALIMDDEDSIRLFLSELLKNMGIAHETAADGEQALALFDAAIKEGKPFDIVFADLTVPGGMGGKEMMRLMRKRDVRFKSVVVSGYSNDPIMSSYRTHGFDACLMKPFKIREFQTAVAALCSGG
jgi:PAS domain S-box-containing protein